MLTTTKHVDWLAVTFDANVPPHYATQVGSATSMPVTPVKPSYGYGKALKDDVGAVVMYQGHENQGTHVCWSGSALAVLRSRGVSDRALGEHVMRLDGRPGRIDLALDIFGGQMTIADIVQAWKDGTLLTPARSVHEYRELDGQGHTLYLGSGSGERFVRCYNKAAEQGTPGTWVRIELSARKRRAQVIVPVLASDPNTGRVISSAIRECIDMMGENEVRQALLDETVGFENVPRKQTDTRRWVIEQVAPALVSYDTLHPDENLLAELTREYERLNGELLKTLSSWTGDKALAAGERRNC